MTGEVEVEDEMWTCKCGDGEEVNFSANKLAEYSGYFSALMNSQMRETREKTLDLRLFTSDSINLLLKMFHLKDSKLSEEKIAEEFGDSLDFESVEDVLKAVDYLDMPCLYPRCSDLLIMIFPPFSARIDTIWKLWEGCQMYDLESLEEAIFKHLAKNITQVECTDYFFFREVPGEVLAGILAVPNIDIGSEIDVMKLIVDWIVYCRDDRQKWFDTLFKCIHVPSLIHSDLTKIDKMLTLLEVGDVSICKMFSSYMANPHKFFISRPELSEIRNGKDVLMMFGGVYEHSLMPHNHQPGMRRRRSPICSIPIMYQDIDEVGRQCLNRYSQEPVTVSVSHNNPRPKPRPPIGSGLFCKAMSRLKSPVRLVEFGVCLYENFVYLCGGERSNNDEVKVAVKGAYRMDPHIGEWSEICHLKEGRCLFSLCNMWGRLYAIGGANQYGILRCTEYYIPEEDQWYEGPQLHTPLQEHAGCIFREKIYISGGHSDVEQTDRVWTLESKDGTWKHVAPMVRPRSYHAMVAIENKMYVFGGCSKSGGEIKDLFCVEEYDHISDTWTRLLYLNVPINSCLPVLIGNELLFVGGYSFDQKEYLQQTVSLNLKKREWKISPLEINMAKKVVGYCCLKLKVKRRILR